MVPEHFTVVEGTAADTGRPTFITMQDLSSGDAFTVAVVDSLEIRGPYALLVVTAAAQLRAYGPFEGEQAAASAAPTLAMTDLTMHASRPVPLHHH